MKNTLVKVISFAGYPKSRIGGRYAGVGPGLRREVGI